VTLIKKRTVYKEYGIKLLTTYKTKKQVEIPIRRPAVPQKPLETFPGTLKGAGS
jgi:hypothetical protein